MRRSCNGNGDNCKRDDPSNTNGGFADADTESVAEREWMRMIDEEACKGIAGTSTRSGTGTIARSHVLLQKLMPSQMETARGAKIAAEKTIDVPLMRW